MNTRTPPPVPTQPDPGISIGGYNRAGQAIVLLISAAVIVLFILGFVL